MESFVTQGVVFVLCWAVVFVAICATSYAARVVGRLAHASFVKLLPAAPSLNSYCCKGARLRVYTV